MEVARRQSLEFTAVVEITDDRVEFFYTHWLVNDSGNSHFHALRKSLVVFIRSYCDDRNPASLWLKSD